VALWGGPTLTVDFGRNIAEGVEMIERITGFHPVGWNAAGLKNSPNTLEILQELGFLYSTK
jgi:peptidoglycan/xylan/chitin deacetylase (PgdA/CDA1 family)